MVDKHVVKMVLESTQLLSTAHRVLDGRDDYVLPDLRESIFYKATHINHPSAVWCRKSIENYSWLAEHLYALLNEYNYRYEKTHKCYAKFFYIQSPPKNLQEYDWTPIPCAMPDEYKISDDPIVNYRNYYKNGKAALHKWKKRQVPDWIL